MGTMVCRCHHQLTIIRGCSGGVENRAGRKTSRAHPSQKGGFGPPFVWDVFHPPQKLFWRGPEIFGRMHFVVRFPLHIRFAPPPPNMAQNQRELAHGSRKTPFAGSLLSFVLHSCSFMLWRVFITAEIAPANENQGKCGSRTFGEGA